MVSEALWIDSNSSSETIGVGVNRCLRFRYLVVEGAIRIVPLPRPVRLLEDPLGVVASSDILEVSTFYRS
jgi:hypothetical protein